MAHHFLFGYCLFFPPHFSSRSRCLLGHIPIMLSQDPPEEYTPVFYQPCLVPDPQQSATGPSFSPKGPARVGVRPFVGPLVRWLERLFRAGTWPWDLRDLRNFASVTPPTLPPGLLQSINLNIMLWGKLSLPADRVLYTLHPIIYPPLCFSPHASLFAPVSNRWRLRIRRLAVSMSALYFPSFLLTLRARFDFFLQPLWSSVS